jgi:hypothetical protein
MASDSISKYFDIERYAVIIPPNEATFGPRSGPRAAELPDHTDPAAMFDPQHANTRLCDALRQRILLIDGAMGTMIQAAGLDEPDYRGERFADWRRTCGQQ